MDEKNLVERVQEAPNQIPKQGILYKIVDYAMGIRKAIRETQPEWYKFIHGYDSKFL